MSLIKFYDSSSEELKKEYKEILRTVSSLSNLFSESSNPYLHYRTMEKVFCKTFNCKNLTRSDITIDAKRDGIGIGLKTFIHKNNGSFEKIAEFNKLSYKLQEINNDLDLAKEVSILRNKRIDFANNSQDVENNIYHLITRDENALYIYEEPMVKINIDKIVVDNVKTTSIHFHDDFNNYSFSKSKNTLFKKFDLKKDKLIEKIDVTIIEDPIETLRKISETELVSKLPVKQEEYIILPLYSDRNGLVHEKSGLNMWNANGRIRNSNEVYIPIPKWIHRVFPTFFTYKENSSKSTSFNVFLPNGQELSMKVTQDNGKALQSNPNKELGEWILRKVLTVPYNTLVTKEMLDDINIDSVQLTKLGKDVYKLDFLSSDSYEKFKTENKS